MKTIAIPLLILSLTSQAQNYSISDSSYFLARDYFLLRSGNAKMIIQGDKADIEKIIEFLDENLKKERLIEGDLARKRGDYEKAAMAYSYADRTDLVKEVVKEAKEKGLVIDRGFFWDD